MAAATMLSGLSTPDGPPLPHCVPSLTTQQTRLLSGVGIWQSIIAMLSAPQVRHSRCVRLTYRMSCSSCLAHTPGVFLLCLQFASINGSWVAGFV